MGPQAQAAGSQTGREAGEDVRHWSPQAVAGLGPGSSDPTKGTLGPPLCQLFRAGPRGSESPGDHCQATTASRAGVPSEPALPPGCCISRQLVHSALFGLEEKPINTSLLASARGRWVARRRKRKTEKGRQTQWHRPCPAICGATWVARPHSAHSSAHGTQLLHLPSPPLPTSQAPTQRRPRLGSDLAF